MDRKRAPKPPLRPYARRPHFAPKPTRSLHQMSTDAQPHSHSRCNPGDAFSQSQAQHLSRTIARPLLLRSSTQASAASATGASLLDGGAAAQAEPLGALRSLPNGHPITKRGLRASSAKNTDQARRFMSKQGAECRCRGAADGETRLSGRPHGDDQFAAPGELVVSADGVFCAPPNAHRRENGAAASRLSPAQPGATVAAFFK